MVGKRLLSMLKGRTAPPPTPTASATEEGKAKSWGRKVVSGALICLTGGVALSALDDLVIYHGCSRKALEKASNSQAIIEAIGEPIERGPWYNASLAVAHKRQSVSCTFPVSGPQGTAIFQLKAVRSGDYLHPPPLVFVTFIETRGGGSKQLKIQARSMQFTQIFDDTWFSILRPRDWEILVMEALLHVPSNEKMQQTYRISVSDNSPPAGNPCTACIPQPSQSIETNQPQPT